MNTRLFSGLALLLLLGIGGCKESTSASSAERSQGVDIPAVPVIKSALFSLSDALVPNRNPLLMEQLCALARGEIQQGNINAFIQQQGGDAQTIPRQGHPLSLLVNGDRKTQIQACAAYLATTVMLPLDLNPLMSSAPQEKTPGTGKPAPKIDQAKLQAILPGKLAIAQANADFFALIAAELQRRPGLTLEQYHQLSEDMFARLAPDYLRRLKEQAPPPETQYRVLQVDADQFAFISTTGAQYAYDFAGLNLQQNGIAWFAGGKLLGKGYFLKVAYLPESAKRLVQP